LPELSGMTFHTLPLSGCLIEAKMTGIPSIIVNNVGREIYEDYIDNDLVYYLDQKSNNFQADFFKLCTHLKENKYTVEARNIVNPILS
jgi:hypothetical protein